MYTLKFASFSLKQADLFSIHENWGRSPKFLTHNQHDSHKNGSLICIINLPLAMSFSSDAVRCHLRKLKTLLAVITDMNFCGGAHKSHM